MNVRQLRVVVETGDYEQAVRFYRDVLGLPEELALDSDGGARVTILAAGRATLELANPAQRKMIDQLEVGRQVSPGIRLAFEVQDAATTTQRLTEGGATQVAPPTRTPWNSLNARLNAPAGLHVTIFEEHDQSAARKTEGRAASHIGTDEEEPMSALQAIADRVEIEALRGEFTDAAMMRDYDRCASLFTPDGALRMPNVPAELAGREEIRAWGERVPALVDYLVQTTHPGSVQIDGDTGSGRAYIQELGRTRDGRSELNYGIYHDRYQRTGDGWKFAERVYEVRYLDHSALAGSVPRALPDKAAPPRR
jgi:ketosteroid isomerase-like protein/predicted enzyme related to lactoylglutathione lyase